MNKINIRITQDKDPKDQWLAVAGLVGLFFLMWLLAAVTAWNSPNQSMSEYMRVQVIAGTSVMPLAFAYGLLVHWLRRRPKGPDVYAYSRSVTRLFGAGILVTFGIIRLIRTDAVLDLGCQVIANCIYGTLLSTYVSLSTKPTRKKPPRDQGPDDKDNDNEQEGGGPVERP